MGISEISAEAFQAKMETPEALKILDVRTGVECRSERLDRPCIHIPLHELEATRFVKEYGASQPVYILCRSGGRAMKAAQELVAAGLTEAVIIRGGLSACKACGVSVTASKTVSLERQVRIAAGTVVLAGVLLGHFFVPSFFILSGMVGAGLIFAGVTDWCGMALLLARAPWNKDRTQEEINKSIEQFNQKGA